MSKSKSGQTDFKPTGRVVDLPNGHNGYCIVIGPGLCYCGETFDPQQVSPEIYAVDRGDDHPHNYLCIDCHKCNSRKLRAAAERQETEQTDD